MGKSKMFAAAIAVAFMAGTAISLPVAAQESVLRFVPSSDLPTLDPSQTTAKITGNMGFLVFDTLFAMDSNLTPHPQMVEDYTISDDGLIYTFTLRDGLKWHDGTPVTAEDCIASLERFFAKDGMGGSLKANTASLVAEDDKTFVLTLSQPFGMVLDVLAKIDQPIPFMYPRSLIGDDPNVPFTVPVGSGPYVYNAEESQAGIQLVFDKNEDYVPRSEPQDMLAGGKVAGTDRIVWTFIADRQTAANALMAGEVDYVNGPPADMLPILRADSNLEVAAVDPRGELILLRFNSLTPPFDDARARQAFAMAVNQQDYLQAAVGPGEGKECVSIYTCDSPYTTDVGAELIGSGDIEAARQLVEESGYDGEPIVLLQPTDLPTVNNFALIAAQELRSIGFNVELAAADWASIIQRRAKKEPQSEGGWNMFITTASGGLLDTPISNLPGKTSCADAWAGWPCDDEAEGIKARFALTSNPDERRQIAEEFQIRVYELMTFVPGGQYQLFDAWNTNVDNVVIGAASPLYGVTKAE